MRYLAPWAATPRYFQRLRQAMFFSGVFGGPISPMEHRNIAIRRVFYGSGKYLARPLVFRGVSHSGLSGGGGFYSGAPFIHIPIVALCLEDGPRHGKSTEIRRHAAKTRATAPPSRRARVLAFPVGQTLSRYLA